MQTFDIIRQVKPKKTFRVASIMGTFDLQTENIIERFKGEIKMPKQWQIGLIVGNSGTGKTTIARELFKDAYITNFDYNAESVLDDMPKDCSVEQIAKTFNSVGFSSPPSWLKPYSVLSNGEKMRCDLARAILSDNEMFVFDEFTSVVDRNVAKVGSFAMQKAIRKTDKKFIAVGCHFDVEDWLLPDWVFDTNTMTFRENEEQKKNRPNIEFRIYETKDKPEYWKMFGKYHYLSHSHNNAARVYIATVDDNICGFCSVLHLPHPKVKNIKRVHRLVILPDYQGIGIGSLLLNKVGEYVKEKGDRFRITTSSPNLIFSLKNNINWRCDRIGRNMLSKTGNINNVKTKGSDSSNRITASFELK